MKFHTFLLLLRHFSYGFYHMQNFPVFAFHLQTIPFRRDERHNYFQELFVVNLHFVCLEDFRAIIVIYI
jgi:hypothetical protein